ncbi:helix-hairpin-helix domain-containing protein [Bacteroidales bacterium]|nr:helix-hairpin-helix domain-containing protein [Bacteroidales bacterium]
MNLQLTSKQKRGYTTLVSIIIILIVIRLYSPKIYSLIHNGEFDSISISTIWFDTIEAQQYRHYQKKMKTEDFIAVNNFSKTKTPTYRNRKPTKKKDTQSKLPISINTAKPFDLFATCKGDTILAFRIIKYRNLLGGFLSHTQLSEVYGFDTTMQYSYFSIDTNEITKIELNTCHFSDLIRHPYINKQAANDILTYRKFKNNINNTTELLQNKILTPQQYAKISMYLSTN